jgi:hypothetical protein
MAKRKPIIQQVKERKWKLIGHTLRKDLQVMIRRQVLDWTAQGRRKRGRPKKTLRRMVEYETGKLGNTWKEVGALAQNRIRWRSFVGALCS